jgi:excisionase family DNA binding protein
MLTTGKAAGICSVTSDTVLKWIKSGIIPGTRTAGGHYRIDQKDLAHFAHKNTVAPNNDALIRRDGNKTPCWEFNAIKGKVNERCFKCIVYLSKAEKCFVMAALGKRAGHQKIFCETSCEKCRYFSYANGMLKVLIVSRNWEQYKFCKTAGDCNIDIRFACCGYEVATMVQHFNADAVLFDETLPEPDLHELVNHLRKDTLLSSIRILFITKGSMRRESLPAGIDSVLKAPFSIPELKRSFFSFKGKK